MENKDNLKNLLWKLQDILENAPAEEDCTDEENTMYTDMTNLVESMNEYLSKKEGN